MSASSSRSKSKSKNTALSLSNERGIKENSIVKKSKKQKSTDEMEFHEIIGYSNAQSVPKEFIAHPTHFHDIPESDDVDFWLNQYPEPLQSYGEYVKEKHRSYAFRKDDEKGMNKKIVYFVAFGEQQDLELSKVAEFSKIYFGEQIEFKILPSVPIQNSPENIAKSRVRSPFFVEVSQEEDMKAVISLKQRRCHRYDVDKTPADHRYGKKQTNINELIWEEKEKYFVKFVFLFIQTK